MERIEAIVQIACALAKNPEMLKYSEYQYRIAQSATRIYEEIETLEIKRLENENRTQINNS